jgi:DNA invertase Pin-like site-specific DNA recombinase
MYARVSTADGRQDTDNQLAQLCKFAATQNWGVVAEYLDHDSGGKSDRVEFRRMFADVAQHRFDVVLVWALDRFTREGVAETFE